MTRILPTDRSLDIYRRHCNVTPVCKRSLGKFRGHFRCMNRRGFFKIHDLTIPSSSSQLIQLTPEKAPTPTANCYSLDGCRLKTRLQTNGSTVVCGWTPCRYKATGRNIKLQVLPWPLCALHDNLCSDVIFFYSQQLATRCKSGPILLPVLRVLVLSKLGRIKFQGRVEFFSWPCGV